MSYLINKPNHSRFAFLADILRFDNSYSWVTNKVVHYELEVIEPLEDKMFKDKLNGAVSKAKDVVESTHF